MFGLLQNVLFPIETEHRVEENTWIACFNIEALQIRGGLTYPLAFPRLSSFTFTPIHSCQTAVPEAESQTSLCHRKIPGFWGNTEFFSDGRSAIKDEKQFVKGLYLPQVMLCLHFSVFDEKKKKKKTDNGKHKKCGNLWHFPYFHVWEKRN